MEQKSQTERNSARKIWNLGYMHKTDVTWGTIGQPHISQKSYIYFRQWAIIPTEQNAVLPELCSLVYVLFSDNEIACNLFWLHQNC